MSAVAIPNDVHEEVGIACMNAGKNVIMEKPVTLSLESLERLIECAKKKRREIHGSPEPPFRMSIFSQ